MCSDCKERITKNGILYMDSIEFEIMCSMQTKFIECIDSVSSDCEGITDKFIQNMLKDRRLAKNFCENSEWKRRYFAAAPCINKHMKWVINHCNEQKKKFDGSIACQVQHNMCEDVNDEFSCKALFTQQLCGSGAGYIYRRIYRFEIGNLDYMCNRLAESKVCESRTIIEHYKTRKPMKRSATNVKRSLIEKIDNLIEIISDAVKSITMSAQTDFITDLQKEFLNIHLLEGLTHRSDKYILLNEKKPSLETSHRKSVSVNIQQTEIPNDSNQLRITKSNVSQEICENINSLNFEIINPAFFQEFSKLPIEIKYLKYSIINLYTRLESNKDVRLDIGNNEIFLHWKHLHNLPLQSVKCIYVNSFHRNSFKCCVKFDFPF